jgi:hypothetical protein
MSVSLLVCPTINREIERERQYEHGATDEHSFTHIHTTIDTVILRFNSSHAGLHVHVVCVCFFFLVSRKAAIGCHSR